MKQYMYKRYRSYFAQNYKVYIYMGGIFLLSFLFTYCQSDSLTEESQYEDTTRISLLENFDSPGKPMNDQGEWSFWADIFPDQKTWKDIIPGDGYAYLKVDSDVSNDTDPTSPYQTLVFSEVGPNHRLEVRMKGAVVDGGLVGFIFTYNQPTRLFNELDIELVAYDEAKSAGEHETKGTNGWTDFRANTWRQANETNYLPGSFSEGPILDILSNKISHIDDQFHTYTIDWRANNANFYIDDVLIQSFNENIAKGESNVILGFRQLSWAGDFRWTGTKVCVIDWLKVEDLHGEPSAKFVADQTKIVPGESVNFYDQSPLATQWEWEFPGGEPSSSSEENPQVSYSTAGNYTVKLITSNDIGSKSTIKESYIIVE